VRLFTVISLLALAAVAAPAASASELIARNATGVRLQVDAQGRALLSYRAGGRARHVLAWGAVDAIEPTRERPQVQFKLDYSGGWGTTRTAVWKSFRNACRPYDGPPLAWVLTACTAPDGSHWALQQWQRMLPNYGLKPNREQAAWELRLSHWRGETAQLEVELDWAYRRFHHLWGRFTYQGQPVHGFRSTSRGNPLDTFGRNLYLDTFDSAYGRGWKRENSFLTHVGSGAFCYGFYSHGKRPAGHGVRYRATIIGPGVTPDVLWQSDAQGAYDRALDRLANERQQEFFSGSPLCRPN
jgi:hypothetical protein